MTDGDEQEPKEPAGKVTPEAAREAEASGGGSEADRFGPDSPIRKDLEYRLAIGDLFEGPLDLLLYLIRKHELDIFDIPIAFVAERYLDYLEVMRKVNIDVAAEYLVMAATLAYIKSRMLLPRTEEEEEGEEEDPRDQLVRQLLERQRFLEAAEKLGDQPLLGKDTWLRPDSKVTEAVDLAAEAPLAQIGMYELVEAFARVLARAKVDLKHEVYLDRLSVSERIHELVEIMKQDRKISFFTLFEDQRERYELVVTFLAILEMVRLKMIRIYQDRDGDDIELMTREGTQFGEQAGERDEREQGQE